jgi:hypothetical protein
MAAKDSSFDPDAYLSQGNGFDPDAYLKGDDSVGQKILNLAGDIATEATVSTAGQALGAATGPGYFAIAPAAGLYGNYLKQRREIERGDRPDYSFGEGIASALLNLMPGGSVLKSTAGTVAKKTGEEIAEAVVKRGVIGAGAATTAGQIETVIEEKRFPTYDEYLSMAKAGAITGAIAGGAEAKLAGKDLSDGAKKLWTRLAGKTEDELAQVIGQIRESGSRGERKAAAEIFDEIGQRTGVIRSEAFPAKFGSEEAGMVGSRPVAIQTVQGPAPIGERPMGGFGSEAQRIGTEVPPAIKPAAESAAVFESKVAAESPQAARVFEEAYQEGQSPAGAVGLRERLAAEEQSSMQRQVAEQQAIGQRLAARQQALRQQVAVERQNAIRAGDFTKAQNLDDIARQIEARRLTSPEVVPSEQRLRETMVKGPGKVGRTMGTDLPTTEDVIREFENVPGVQGKAGAKRLGLASVGGAGVLAMQPEAEAKGMNENKETAPEIGGFEVEHPQFGVLKYSATWTKEQIQDDINKRDVEFAKMQAADPQLKLRERFEQAQTPGEKLSVLQEFGPVAASMGVRMAGGAAAGYAPPLARPFIGAGTEALALGIEDKPITMGKLGRGAVEATVTGKSGQLAKNALKFMGVNVSGEAVEEYLDRGGLISLDTAARQAALGGAQGVVTKFLDKGKLAAIQREAATEAGPIIRTLTLANERGLIVDPVMYSRTPQKKVMVWASGGSNDFQKYASVVNEPRIAKLAREDLGIDGALDNKAFAAKRAEHASIYRDVQKVSPDAEKAVLDWRRANEMARDQYRKAATKEGSVDAQRLAREASRDADAAFKRIEAEVSRAGQTHLIDDLELARRRIARTYAYEAAANPATGRFDNAKVWGMMYRDAPEKFTEGHIEALARLSAAMPEVMQDTSKIVIGKAASDGLVRGAVNAAMSGVNAPARRIVGGEMYQSMNFLPKEAQLAAPDAAARASRFLMSDIESRTQPQRPVPYR